MISFQSSNKIFQISPLESSILKTFFFFQAKTNLFISFHLEIKIMAVQVGELDVGWHCWKPQSNPWLLINHHSKAGQMLQRAFTNHRNNQEVSQEWICSTGLVWLKSQAVWLCRQCSVCAWGRVRASWLRQGLLCHTHIWWGPGAALSRGILWCAEVRYHLHTPHGSVRN